MTTPVHIRWMIHRDLPEVLRIETASFDDPWAEEDFVLWLRENAVIGMVAEHRERVIGFMIYELHRTFLQVRNFGVSPEFRRGGVGTQLVQKLKSKLSPQRRTRLRLEVRETNLPAQLFFRALGFRAVSILPNRFCDREDAYLMQYRLVTPQPSLAPRG